MIAQLEEQLGKYERAGFTNCENALQIRKKIENLRFDKYKSQYPSYLYFTDDAFDEIIKRNNLVISNVEAYTGNIPDECLVAILNENIKDEDIRKNYYLYKIKLTYNKSWKYSSGKFLIETENPNEIEILNIGNKNDIIFLICEKENIRFNSLMEKMIGYIDNNSLYKYYIDDIEVDVELYYNKNYSDLMIACPKNMINKNFKKILNLFSRKIEAPRDPIVFRYIKDGVLVITFWK